MITVYRKSIKTRAKKNLLNQRLDYLEKAGRMNDIEDLPRDARLTDPRELETQRGWDSGDKLLLIEDETVFAEDLVRLGLGWQDFGNLVVRAKS